MEYGKQQLRLKIKKSSKGTYFIQSMRMKERFRLDSSTSYISHHFQYRIIE